MRETRMQLAIAVGLGIGYLATRLAAVGGNRRPVHIRPSMTREWTLRLQGMDGDVLPDRPPSKETARKNEQPRKMLVVMLNDDYTTTGFVKGMLMKHFGKGASQAAVITEQVHNEGRAIAGMYQHDVAETKRAIVMDEAKRQEMPFKIKLEPA